MLVNIYRDGGRVLEERAFFFSLKKAELYCEFICPMEYGHGNYYPVIVGR
jgi:hypothetical protein